MVIAIKEIESRVDAFPCRNWGQTFRHQLRSGLKLPLDFDLHHPRIVQGMLYRKMRLPGDPYSLQFPGSTTRLLAA